MTAPLILPVLLALWLWPGWTLAGVAVGGVTGGEEGWLTFAGYGGHTFRIQKPTNLTN